MKVNHLQDTETGKTAQGGVILSICAHVACLMQRRLLLFVLAGAALFVSSCNQHERSGTEMAPDSLVLWYSRPASDAQWTDALPVGNGHIGAMLFGGVDTAHIQFNEATLWTDGPRQYAHPGAYKYLPKIRELIFSGKQQEAEAVGEAHFMGIKNHDPEAYLRLKKAWLAKVRRDTAAARENLDDSHWKTMQLPLINGWETAGLQGVDGALWFRVDFDVPQDWKGKDLYIDLGRIRDQDYCYVNGHYVGQDEGISTKRHYLLKAADLHTGKNVLAVQVVNFYDKGGFTGVKNDRPIFVVYPASKTPKEGKPVAKTWKYWIQDNEPPAYPQYEASYQPFGDIYIQDLNKGKVSDYRRSLDLRSATAQVAYKKGDVHFSRTAWVSAADPAMVVHFEADQNGAVNFKARFSTLHEQHQLFKIDDSTVGMRLRVKDGVLRGYSALRIKAKGRTASVTVSDSAIEVSRADQATIYMVAATSFVNYKDVSGKPDSLCSSYLQAIEDIQGGDYQALYRRHETAYQQLFNTFDIRLGARSKLTIPTDQRIREFTATSDPGLLTLYTQYARYLMISATPPGGHAANLQGIWNNLLTPPWESKYTTNINLEMNYWPAELLNLSSCTTPLFGLIKVLSVTGEVTAREHYGAPGWVLHHNADIWGATAPIDAAKHGIWNGGSAWLSYHLWEHFLFTQDTAFLKETGYPLMRKAAEFYAHFMIIDPRTGYLVSVPSNSPEHGGLVAGPTIDNQLIRALFTACIQAAKILKTDTAFSKTLAEKYPKIAPNKIGRAGQLQEWQQDIDDTTDTYRHVSHLWGVYPGNDISWDRDPAMMRAARQSLIYRGDGGTGWSLAWKVNLWARFKDGNHVMKLLKELLRPAEGVAGQERGGVYRNMMDAHPPFQIDGNFGGAAGVAEMLIQSQNGYIDLLPALPDSLPTGWVRGVRARGGYELNFWWEGGRLSKVEIKGRHKGACTIHYGKVEKKLNLEAGRVYCLNGQLALIADAGATAEN